MCIIHTHKDIIVSKKDKIIKDLKNNPNNVRFETLKILLESEGYECFNNGFKSYNRRMNYERLRLLS